MKIEVKNISVNLANSEETHCFSAIIHVNGKKAFAIRNEGRGGCDFIHSLPGYAGPSQTEVNDWLKANRPADNSHGFTIEHDLEIEVGDQVNDFLQKRDRKRIEAKLDRMMATHVVGIRGGTSVVTWKIMPSAITIAKLRAAKPDVDFVNDGGPEARARALKAYCPSLDQLVE